MAKAKYGEGILVGYGEECGPIMGKEKMVQKNLDQVFLTIGPSETSSIERWIRKI